MEDWPEEDVANYRGTEYIGKLGIEQAYEAELHGTTGVEQVETSAGGRPCAASQPAATPGNTAGAVDRHQAAGPGGAALRRAPRRAGGIDPRNGEVLAFVSKPTFDPNLFVDGIDADSWAPQRGHRQAAAQPGAARHLPAGLDLQALHGHGGADTGKRGPGHHHPRQPHFFMLRRHACSAARWATRLGPVDMRRLRSSSPSNVYYYSLANEMGVDLIHDS
jgi:penicillin-binding protein 2